MHRQHARRVLARRLAGLEVQGQSFRGPTAAGRWLGYPRGAIDPQTGLSSCCCVQNKNYPAVKIHPGKFELGPQNFFSVRPNWRRFRGLAWEIFNANRVSLEPKQDNVMEVENSLGPPYGGRHANQIKGRHEHQFRPLGPTGRTEHSRSHMHFPLLTLLPILAVQMGNSPFCLLSNDWVVRDRNLPVLLRGRNKASRLSMASFSAGRLGQSAQSACQR